MKSDLAKEASIDSKTLPSHVAIIMDGNGRWARQRLLNRVKGHEQGSRIVREIVKVAGEMGVPILTLYAFSTENWARPESEVKALMMLLKKFIVNERDELHQNRIRLNVIGQIHKLPADVQQEIEATLAMTRHNERMILNLALSYGARQELTMAMRGIAEKIASRAISPEDVTEDLISDHLYTRQMPDPDLIIRTSGEYRLSNFLLWQAAYSELYISPTLWPDFTKDEFIQILIQYQNRDRRFGRVSCSTSSDG